jgi:outer membrane protein assembly factor BamB
LDRERTHHRYASTGYQSAVGVTVVAGVFAVIIAALLAVHLYHYSVTDPTASATLEAMKEHGKADPTDKSLSDRIIALDTQLRRDQLARLQFLKRGTFLLVGTLALGIGSFFRAQSYHPKLPSPTQLPDLKVEQVLHARRVRASLTTTVTFLAAGAIFWGLYTPTPEKAAFEADQSALAAPEPQDEDVSFASMDEMQDQWPAFRGPSGLGVSTAANVPTEWDAASENNILWKTPVPLEGHSSPVVWGNRIFVTGASETSQKVFCFDADTGKPLWSADVAISTDPERADMYIMEDTGHAAPTPVTDGRRVCAIFADGQIACFTIDGRSLWQVSLGIPDSMYGYAASLTAFEDKVIVQWDVGTGTDLSKLIALNWQTGEVLWQTPRPVPNSWSSPTVARVGDGWQVLTAAAPYVIAYDAQTGTELYRADCIDGDIAATPIIAAGKIITMQPYQKLTAINTAEASGDVTASHIAWEVEGPMPDICSPLSDGSFVWTLTSSGELDCFHLADGREVYKQSLDMMFQASPVLAQGKLYLLSQDGVMLILEAADEYKELHRNALDEDCFASPAFADGRIYIRTTENLYCIGSAQ